MPRAYYGGMKIAAVGLIGLGVMLGIWQLSPRAAAENDKSAAFLQRHWRVPIPLQGTPPATYSAVEASLHPKDCGICHPQQYQDWQSSRHSRSMGPGVHGQLVEMDPATSILCATCHAPLSEQLPHIERRVRIVVHPEHFYQRFFAATLQDGGGGTGRAHLEEALRLTQTSPFTVFEQTLPLKTPE